jgi:DNA-binding NtrC family response regulator
MSAPSTTTSPDGWLSQPPPDGSSAEQVGLVIVWSYSEPGRLGEVAFLPVASGPALLGRGPGDPGDPAPRLRFVRQRPGGEQPTPPLEGPALSRAQILLDPGIDAVRIERLGRCRTLVRGEPVDRAVVRPGDLIFLDGELLLLCVERPRRLPAPGSYPPAHAFGEADAHGLVGESPAAWALRERIEFVGPRGPHVLVLGETGTGKELVALALHARSPRARRPIVSRNAATFPPGLIDAELFGNARNYPNPGLAERPGLLGEANGSTLFLDEIGEMPPELQAHLLRVLDAGGEYQRLGEATVRTTDVRLVAATNRPSSALKHDFLARLQITITVPGLDARREDIPLLARHLLRRTAASDPALAERFFSKNGGALEPRVSPLLMAELVRHTYTRHVRELQALLWASSASSPRNFLDLTGEVRALLVPAPSAAERSAPPTAEEIRACLERCDGSVSRAYRELALSSRDALYRLMKKHGIPVKRGEGD